MPERRVDRDALDISESITRGALHVGLAGFGRAAVHIDIVDTTSAGGAEEGGIPGYGGGDAEQIGIGGGGRRGERPGGSAGRPEIYVEVEAPAVRGRADDVRSSGDVRHPGRRRKLAQERVAGTVLRHVAAVDQQVAAGLQRGADFGKLRLVA